MVQSDPPHLLFPSHTASGDPPLLPSHPRPYCRFANGLGSLIPPPPPPPRTPRLGVQTHNQVHEALLRTLEGHQRQILGTLTVEELYKVCVCVCVCVRVVTPLVQLRLVVGAHLEHFVSSSGALATQSGTCSRQRRQAASKPRGHENRGKPPSTPQFIYRRASPAKKTFFFLARLCRVSAYHRPHRIAPPSPSACGNTSRRCGSFWICTVGPRGSQLMLGAKRKKPHALPC